MTLPDRSERRSQAPNLALLGCLYLVAASFSAGLSRFHGAIAFIWVANAILLATLHCSPRSTWRGQVLVCFLASAIATSMFGMGTAPAVPLAIVNVSEAMAGAILLRRLADGSVTLSSGRQIFHLLMTALLASGASGVLGAGIATLATGRGFLENWLTWTCGHALGVLTFTPFTLLVLQGDVVGGYRSAAPAEKAKSALLLSLVTAASLLAFAQTTYPLLFVPFVPITFAVFRMGRLGAVFSLILLSAIASILTASGYGPMHLLTGGAGTRAQFLQLYLAAVMLTALPAAAELKRRKTMFSDLERNAALHQVIADRTGDVLMTSDVDGTISYVSPSIKTMTGFDPSAFVGRRGREFIVQEDRREVVSAHLRALARPDETVMVDYRVRRASGEIGWFESHIRAIVTEDGGAKGAVSIIREISARKARETDLAIAAATDPLTGLLNRRALEAAFRRQVAEGGRGPAGCVAVFDLDHFKRVNDAYGHAAGDLALRQFAVMLSRGVRGGDVVARTGGEEFAALLVGASLEQAQLICERIRNDVRSSQIDLGNGKLLEMTVSVGLGNIDHAHSLEGAMAAADAALYRAKKGGRNRLAIAA